MDIARRDALKSFLAAWMAGTSAAQTMHHDGMHPGPAALPAAPQFFRPEEYRTVELLTEMIIPTDEKPGAREAQVARFIDFLVYSAAEYELGLQEQWIRGLAQLDRLSREQFGRAFRDLDPADREKLLTAMSQPEHDPSAAHPGYPFYRLVKSMTVEGFYSSRVGLIDVLEYKGLAALAEFPGCTHPEHKG